MRGAKPPTFWKAFPSPRGRPDLKNAPPKIRPDWLQVPRRMLASFLILFAILAILGLVFPILNMLLASTSNAYLQALIVVSFLVFKLVFEKLGVVAIRGSL